MVYTIRKSEDRGKAHHGWLSSSLTFSFGEYYDPHHMGFRVLRVINEDKVAPGQGFGTHPHKDMEILSYVIKGSLAHRDSMGNGRTIQAGELQMMSAGSGITHSEFNASTTEEVHFLQIWIIPETKNFSPSYAEWKPTTNDKTLTLIASSNGQNGSVIVHQNIALFIGKMAQGENYTYTPQKERYQWIQIIEGNLAVGEVSLQAGDGVALSEADAIDTSARSKCTYLLFDLP